MRLAEMTPSEITFWNLPISKGLWKQKHYILTENYLKLWRVPCRHQWTVLWERIRTLVPTAKKPPSHVAAASWLPSSVNSHLPAQQYSKHSDAIPKTHHQNPKLSAYDDLCWVQHLAQYLDECSLDIRY